MNRITLAFLIPALGIFTGEVWSMDSADPTTALVQGNSAFALDLYGRISRGEGNRFISPFSISCALAMTYAGAQDETALQIAKTLHFTLPPEKLHPSFHHLIADLHSRNTARTGSKETADVELLTANALWSQAGQSALQALPLPPYTSQRRAELLSLYVQLQKRIQELDKEVEAQARQRPPARRLLTHPGVGPVTALATDVFLGDPSRFATANQVASYIGMIPSEHSSGGRQKLGALSKQGNSLLRYLWVEAAMHAVRKDPDLQRFYRRKLVQKGLGKARIAVARKLGIRLWIMLRDQIDYQEFCRRGQMRQKSGGARAGMPDFNSGPALQ